MDDVLDFPFHRNHPLDLPPEYEGLRASDGISRVRIWDGSEAWLITRHEDSRALLKDPRLSSNTELRGFPHQNAGVMSQRSKRTFISMDSPEHAHYRQMVTGDFSVKRIEGLRDDLDAIVDARLDALDAHGAPADLVDLYALPITSAAICLIVGVPYSDHDFFQDRSRKIVARGVSVEEGQQATEDLWGYLKQLLVSRYENPEDDLMSRLASNIVDGKLTEDEAVNIALVLLFGGHETTANQIMMGVILLLEHPDQLKLLRSNPELLGSAVEEIHRFANVTHYGRRRVALEDIEVRGQVIRAGEGVIVANDAANRDGTIFEHPERFDITRDARAQTGFGYGVHQCVGQRLARAEVVVAIDKLFKRFPELQLVSDLDDVEFKDGVVYGVEELEVSW
ncbi:MAG: cytochrome P450 [Microthrixaceae bacterium]